MLRNIAIIAHVDHGKTTLIDSIMKQTGLFRENQHVEERLMDSGDLEKERGITILAKPTSVVWKDTRINIIDTPGHADFGGEVERVLGMADGVILLTDAAEGPMPQTKFVLGKALKQGLGPIVVINKIDRPDGRPDAVVDEVFDLFVSLDASDEQLDFPILYASGRDGWCVTELDHARDNLHPLLDTVLTHVPTPQVEPDKPFAMLATLLDSDPYIGRCLTGRVIQGTAKVNEPVKAINLAGDQIETGRLTKLLRFEGTERVAVEAVQAGDLICIAGLTKASVADTICDPQVTQALESTPVDPPTMSVTITVNDSPFAGKEGKKVTSTVIRERLLAEAETNVAITFNESANKDAFEIGGRGELQLGVLIETMRREGFEMNVSRPRVLVRVENDERLEPIEEVTNDVLVSRCGYTGEDGFEISLPPEVAAGFAETLLADTRVALIGLGARDSLRLEAGLCLYGHDIDEITSPIEADLLWTIPKRRRESADYPGADVVSTHLASGTKRQRVGLLPEGRAPAREGAQICAMDGTAIGAVTSGGFSPTLERPVAMGYVDTDHANTDTRVQLIVRGKPLPARVVAMPFVPHRYKRA